MIMNVSIILPVYNAELYLSEALDSVLAQTYRDFELICIDDGSTDASLSILTKYSKIDSRIVVVSRENKGLVYTLNEAIKMSKCRYVARMDADDICEPSRLEKQITLMNTQNLAVVGSSYSYIDDKGDWLGVRNLPTKNFIIKYLMDFGSPFCHPSVIFNKELLGDDLVYDANFTHCEDYELWLRCRDRGYDLGNLKDITFNYRVLNTSVSRVYAEEQKRISIGLIKRYCSYVHSDNEAEYLLYGRRDNLVWKYNLRFIWRLCKSSKLFNAIFVSLYLLR